MPSLLSDAYGTSFVVDMEPITSKFVNNKRLGTTDQIKKTQEPLAPLLTKNQTIVHRDDGNYVIQININRDDCHLLCIFLGVFTLAVLFSKNKKP